MSRHKRGGARCPCVFSYRAQQRTPRTSAGFHQPLSSGKAAPRATALTTPSGSLRFPGGSWWADKARADAQPVSPRTHSFHVSSEGVHPASRLRGRRSAREVQGVVAAPRRHTSPKHPHEPQGYPETHREPCAPSQRPCAVHQEP